MWGVPAVFYDAVGDLTLMDDKWGPSISHFQIRSLRNPDQWGALDRMRVAELLRDPTYASKAAYAISKQGTDFTPWSAFKSGNYLPHVGKDYQLVWGHPDRAKWSA